MPQYTTLVLDELQTRVLVEIIEDFYDEYVSKDPRPKPTGDNPDMAEWIKACIDEIAPKENDNA